MITTIYGFFDAILENGEYDREVDADFFTNLFSALAPNGVTGFTVSAGDGMNVSVAGGKGFINGHFCVEEDTTTLTLTSTTAQRTYALCIRLDTDARDISIVANTDGVPMRTETVHDLCFAKVIIPANASATTNAMITDTRSDAALCGLLNPTTGNGRPILNGYVQSSQPSNPSVGDLWLW